jgi:hypothetical protein
MIIQAYWTFTAVLPFGPLTISNNTLLPYGRVVNPGMLIEEKVTYIS